jgi:endonuclease YncB( thermonuclease family)
MKAFFLPLCLGLGLIAPPATAQSLSGQADVVDGDTLVIRGEKTRVRLYGVDAPEGQQTCDDAERKRYLC